MNFVNCSDHAVNVSASILFKDNVRYGFTFSSLVPHDLNYTAIIGGGGGGGGGGVTQKNPTPTLGKVRLG